MVDHGAEKNLMQDFGAGGFHACAFACSENNCDNRWIHGANLSKGRREKCRITVENKEWFDKAILSSQTISGLLNRENGIIKVQEFSRMWHKHPPEKRAGNLNLLFSPACAIQCSISTP